MAKTQVGFEIDDNGRMHQFSGKVTRGQRKSGRAGEFAWTRGPDTRGRKIARALWG
ncbi:hypothetical protein [Paractinoplanes brasiliensis]|uniref:Uncharacterized protein n=1 Tax=Paractinoplanes brasiliensis TaxID=52695 RepID=A0A4R6JPF1_9ACTN|nr:hypothetical protein [Actinoplanes brasiliensis]TDO38393.1 hypothetical protein C8E87_2046 [Actinoplanes brasiliensis]GID26830.1 hypothetical protein Abr02nite_18130 [Actinoplanes brasiliensis]